MTENKELAPLPFRCNVWIHYDKKKWTLDGYQCIYSSTSIKELWEFFNHIHLIGGLNQFYFFAMKNNIKPIWEDKANYGHVTIQLSAVRAEEQFYAILALWFSKEIHEDSEAINGVTVRTPDNNPRISIISIWTAKAVAIKKFHTLISTAKDVEFKAFKSKANYRK